jgi:hypothetical protein
MTELEIKNLYSFLDSVEMLLEVVNKAKYTSHINTIRKIISEITPQTI